MLDSELRDARATGEVLFQRNDYTNSFYMIVAGEVRVEGDGRHRSSRWAPASSSASWASSPAAAARAPCGPAADCVLVEAPRRAMLKLIASVESVRRQIDETFLKRAVRAYLAPMLPEEELAELVASGVEVRRYGGGETLFKEGDAPDGLYLLRRGSVMVSRTLGGREVVLSYLSAGNYVGEMALLTDTPRSATVRAAVTTEAVVLDAGAFKSVLAPQPEVARGDGGALPRPAARQRADGGRARPGQHHRLPAAAGRGRGDGRPAHRRVAVRALRQLREGLRRRPRRHLAARPRGRARRSPRSTCRPRAGTASTRTA